MPGQLGPNRVFSPIFTLPFVSLMMPPFVGCYDTTFYMAVREAGHCVQFLIIFLGSHCLSQTLGEGLACCIVRKGGWMSALWFAIGFRWKA